MILTYLILALLGIIWVSVSVMSGEFYSTGKKNRFRFRYWFSIGMLNVFYIILAYFYKAGGIVACRDAGLLTFLLIDALMLEVFIIPTETRKLELFIRTAFYFSLVLGFINNIPHFALINAGILIFLVNQGKFKDLRKHFTISFVLLGIANALPYFTGATNLLLFASLVYSAHIALGVRKLYHQEKTGESMKDRIRKEH